MVGGMERLNWHLADELAARAEVHLVAPSCSARAAPESCRFYGVSPKPLWRFLAHAHWRTCWHAVKWRPHWVLAGSGLTAPVAWLAARLCGARAAAYVHGLDLAVQHPLYKALWFPALRRMDLLIANSQATALLASRAGVPPTRVVVIHPGVALPSNLPTAGQVAALRQELGLGERPVLLSVGRLTTRKGLGEFVTEVLPRIVAQRPDVLLLIVGDAPVDALYAREQSPATIRAAAAAAGVANNVRLIGTIADSGRLGLLYAAASVHVFPVRQIEGDPEGFGMGAVESAAYGLQTVAYATGGVGDAVAGGVSGCLVEPGDAEGFACAVLSLLADPLPVESIQGHATQFAWPRFGERVWAGLGVLGGFT